MKIKNLLIIGTVDGESVILSMSKEQRSLITELLPSIYDNHIIKAVRLNTRHLDAIRDKFDPVEMTKDNTDED